MVSLLIKIIVFLFALGGMIFLHELGHFIAARWAKIEVEEFGFGLPPRAFGFWRKKGYFVLNGERVEIPVNFDLKLDWTFLQQKFVSISADKVEDKLILCSLKYTDTQQTSSENPRNAQEISVNRDGKPAAPDGNMVSKTLSFGKEQGAIQMEGRFSEIHSGTLFSINWLPFGGFIRPKGENDPTIPGGLASANPWKRLVVLVAGPLMNLLTAVIVFSVLVGLEGIPVPGSVKIGSVAENSPAQQADIQAGDILLAVNGESITDIQPAIDIIKSNLDKPVELLIERNGEKITITATPLSSRKKEEGALGIGLTYPTRAATFTEITAGGVMITGVQAATLLYIPVAIVQGVIAPEDARVVGFKGIFDMFNIAVEEDVSTRQEAAAAPAGAPAPEPTNLTLSLIGLLSISLGVMNLLPIPALDGGRILFTLPEILFHRRIPPERENMVNGIAMLMLIALLLFVNVMDFINPVQIPVP